jgi:hypothetical protein
MYVISNGDGYVFHNDDGIHILNEDELPATLQDIKEHSSDGLQPFVYRLIPVDGEFKDRSTSDLRQNWSINI